MTEATYYRLSTAPACYGPERDDWTEVARYADLDEAAAAFLAEIGTGGERRVVLTERHGETSRTIATAEIGSLFPASPAGHGQRATSATVERIDDGSPRGTGVVTTGDATDDVAPIVMPDEEKLARSIYGDEWYLYV